MDERITPCIDFGHLNARTLGGIASKADYAAILDKVEAALGGARAKRFHVHFSRIEYSAGGENAITFRRDPVRPGTPAPDGVAGRTGLGACHHLRERRDTGGGCLYDATALWGGGIAQAMTERFFVFINFFTQTPCQIMWD